MFTSDMQSTKERKAKNEAFFVAANGFSGFRSRYGELFSSGDFERVFVIKGGPGTGKSHLMRELACAGEAAGAGCTYIYCSSDPASLDGTAPHMRDAEIPGAVDELIDLGTFWNADLLRKRREEICRLLTQKASAYRSAYRFLALAGEADSAREELLTTCINHEKMERAAQRELRLLRISHTPVHKVAYLSAFSMSGRVRLDTYRDTAHIISVSDPFGASRFYLEALVRILADEGLYSFTRIPSCFSDGISEGVYLPENNILFLSNSSDNEYRNINMKRFLYADKIAAVRAELRLFDRVREEMLAAAESALRRAGVLHGSLEKIYGEAMDFPEKERFTSSLTARVTALLAQDD